MNRGKHYIVFLLILTSFASLAQDENEELSKFEFRGYIKELATFNFADQTYFDNLIHNRLNFKWYATSDLTLGMELRNRLFMGDQLKMIPNYSDLIDVNNDYFDLSVIPVDDDNAVLHLMIDRFYVQWRKNDWEITAGRQRINWGTNLVWNPNDLFNAYSFFDFDYEERPGSDAIRIVKYTGFASSVEFAASAGNRPEDIVAAGLYKFNKWNYDLQFLGGISRGDIAIGTGWAGNISNAGFKGEITYFHPFNDDPFSEKVLSASISADYSFPSSLYLHTSFLYNSGGMRDPSFLNLALADDRLTAKNLMPYTYSTFLQASFTFSPLVKGGMAFMYFPGSSGFFLNPNVALSIHQNLDLDIISQLFFVNDDSFNTSSKVLFIRLKWSF